MLYASLPEKVFSHAHFPSIPLATRVVEQTNRLQLPKRLDRSLRYDLTEKLPELLAALCRASVPRFYNPNALPATPSLFLKATDDFVAAAMGVRTHIEPYVAKLGETLEVRDRYLKLVRDYPRDLPALAYDLHEVYTSFYLHFSQRGDNPATFGSALHELDVARSTFSREKTDEAATDFLRIAQELLAPGGFVNLTVGLRLADLERVELLQEKVEALEVTIMMAAAAGDVK